MRLMSINVTLYMYSAISCQMNNYRNILKIDIIMLHV